MKIIMAVFFALFSHVSMASYINGNKLKEWMGAHDRVINRKSMDGDAQDGASLQGYIMGVADVLDHLSVTCIPNGVTVGQIVAIAAKYINDSPERWSEPAENLVAASLKKSFPCEKSKTDTSSTSSNENNH